jgi:Holliday junction resolvase
MIQSLPQSRSPKQLGDFGEGLVTYALIRKGFEVAYVDHVGADLIAEKDGSRIALSVKTRLFRPKSKESHMVAVESSNIEKLKYFSNQFNMEPVFAQVICLADNGVIHLFMFREKDMEKVLPKIKNGFSIRFSYKNINKLKDNSFIDYSCWENERIGRVLVGLLNLKENNI